MCPDVELVKSVNSAEVFMDKKTDGSIAVQEQDSGQYVPPVVKVMSESEILSAFQVNAAPTMGWWVA